MTNPSMIAKPVERTPKTPAARSPSWKRLPAGAFRRTSSMIVTVTMVTTATMTSAHTNVIARAYSFVGFRRLRWARVVWSLRARAFRDPDPLGGRRDLRRDRRRRGSAGRLLGYDRRDRRRDD